MPPKTRSQTRRDLEIELGVEATSSLVPIVENVVVVVEKSSDKMAKVANY
jgi:hypothetical protein